MEYKNLIETCIVPKLLQLEFKKQCMPQDLLGRSLAYSCFLPRLADSGYLYENFRRPDGAPPFKGLCVKAEKLPHILQTSTLDNRPPALDSLDQKDEILCVLLEEQTQGDDVDSADYIGLIRRLTPAFIIQSGVVIDSYQILEAAVVGADFVLLDARLLRAYALLLALTQNLNCKTPASDITSLLATQNPNPNDLKEHKQILKELLNKLVVTASNLGLAPIIKVHDKEDLSLLLGLKQAIDCLLSPQDLVRLVPNSYLIFSESKLADGEENAAYGVDVLLRPAD